MGKEGGASPLVGENYLRAQMLCEQLGESEHLYPILWGLWFHRYISSELRQACELADRLLEVGQNRNDTELLLEAHHCQWVVRFIGGDLTTALKHCDRGKELYRPEAHHALAFTYGGHDPGVCALNFSGISLWLLGYPEQSQEKLESAIRLATKLAHSETLTTTLQFFLVACTLQRNEEIIEQKAKELLKFAEDEESFDSINIAKGLIGLIMFQRGDKQEGLEFMLESVGRWLKISSPWSAVSISLVAESLGQMGEAKEGLKMVGDTISLGQRNGVHWCEAELYRVKGKLLLSISTEVPSRAEDAFQRAIEIAREQNAKSLELRAAMDLASLWKARDKAGQARELLGPVYEWFTEGFDTADLRQAKELLEELT
jgi:predicted ATPase